MILFGVVHRRTRSDARFESRTRSHLRAREHHRGSFLRDLRVYAGF